MRPFYIVFTVTVANPAVFTSADHGLYAGDQVYLETTGALPTGLSIHTTYYVLLNGITANTFELSATKDGDAIVTSGSQNGSHSWIRRNGSKLIPKYQDNH